MGNGIGFLTYQLNEVVSLGVSGGAQRLFAVLCGSRLFRIYTVASFHNHFKNRLISAAAGITNTAAVTALLTVYLIIVSSTDNTINYPLLTTVMGVIIMGNGYEQRVKTQQQRFETGPLFG